LKKKELDQKDELLPEKRPKCQRKRLAPEKRLGNQKKILGNQKKKKCQRKLDQKRKRQKKLSHQTMRLMKRLTKRWIHRPQHYQLAHGQCLDKQPMDH
jgi:hypothetical protein